VRKVKEKVEKKLQKHMFTLCTIVATKFICVGSDSYISTTRI
jgi:hypothetical protein